ncbi:hypothetical protein DFJ77DRAFT_441018 [Powellomyces hirtus]|nr:hypothetical protein DFJ77DRAFT_441018 [Powellomyces hirtus]
MCVYMRKHRMRTIKDDMTVSLWTDVLKAKDDAATPGRAEPRRELVPLSSYTLSHEGRVAPTPQTHKHMAGERAYLGIGEMRHFHGIDVDRVEFRQGGKQIDEVVGKWSLWVAGVEAGGVVDVWDFDFGHDCGWVSTTAGRVLGKATTLENCAGNGVLTCHEFANKATQSDLGMGGPKQPQSEHCLYLNVLVEWRGGQWAGHGFHSSSAVRSRASRPVALTLTEEYLLEQLQLTWDRGLELVTMVMEKFASILAVSDRGGFKCGPFVDGDLIPLDRLEVVRAGAVTGIQLLIGINLDETILLMRLPPSSKTLLPATEKQIDKMFKLSSGEDVKGRILASYPSYPPTPPSSSLSMTRSPNLDASSSPKPSRPTHPLSSTASTMPLMLATSCDWVPHTPWCLAPGTAISVEPSMHCPLILRQVVTLVGHHTRQD